MGGARLNYAGNIFWLASYPKSGNTWLRIFLGQMLGHADARTEDINRLGVPHGAANSRYNFDDIIGIDAAELEQSTVDMLRPRVYEVLSAEAKSPVYMKTHDAWQLTPAGEPLYPKNATKGVIHIVRDPRDVAVSMSHFNASPVDEMIDFMAEPDVCFINSGHSLRHRLRTRTLDWSGHAQSWLECPLPRLTVRYEDMLHDSLNTFTCIAKFAQIEAGEKKILQAIAACSFSRLRELEDKSRFADTPREADRFFRTGQSGGWKGVLSDAQVERIVEVHGSMMQRLGYCLD